MYRKYECLSCICCMLVCCMHPVAFLNDAYCVTCSLVILVEDLPLRIYSESVVVHLVVSWF